MSIEDNSIFLRTLIDQLSLEEPSDSKNLGKDHDQVLLGLRDLFDLQMITGLFIYGTKRDPFGFLMTSGTRMLLTRRGALFKR